MEKRIAAIYCVWADWDMLKYSVDNIRPVVDGIIVIGSYKSNYGNTEPINWQGADSEFFHVEPFENATPHQNETYKRNYGLDIARNQGYTHFIMMDADEFYLQHEFTAVKQDIYNRDIPGQVCRLQVYFKKPTLCTADHTLVPFIHKLTNSLRFGAFKDYPFAYDAAGNAHIDPTRRLNVTAGIEMSAVTMHHMSWVRKDVNVKIENSSARNNLKKSSIYKDLENAKPGVYNEFYRANLVSCDNYFNIPGYD